MTNTELIREFYRSLREHDIQTLRQICTDDLEWIEYEGLPDSCLWKGAEAIFTKITQGDRDQWEGLTYEIEEILETDSAVVVLGHQENPSQSTSQNATTAHVYDIRDHKVWRLRMFDHAHLMLQAVAMATGHLAGQTAQ
ncbi:MAG: nuclear transport factor 2 family protein [Cyanobacteria bacterium J06626_18]